MRIDVVTLFPEMVGQALSHSIMGRAQASGQLQVQTVNPRDFATDRHRSVDDTPYGGGPGMVMMAPPIEAALHFVSLEPGTPVVLMDPAGPLFHQRDAREFAALPRLVLVCGHYEGVDERVRTKLCTHAYSVGDFVLTGGELPALMVIDAVVRLLPGVLGDPASHEDDSHEGGLLGHPLFTRPETFQGETVPDVLKSGDHGAISRWRRQQSLLRTRRDRPDLFAQADLTQKDIDLL